MTGSASVFQQTGKQKRFRTDKGGGLMERLKEIKRLQKINMALELICIIPLALIIISILYWVIKLHCAVDLPLLIACIVLGVVLYALVVYKELKLRERIKEIDKEQ